MTTAALSFLSGACSCVRTRRVLFRRQEATVSQTHFRMLALSLGARL